MFFGNEASEHHTELCAARSTGALDTVCGGCHASVHGTENPFAKCHANCSVSAFSWPPDFHELPDVVPEVMSEKALGIQQSPARTAFSRLPKERLRLFLWTAVTKGEGDAASE